MSTLRDVAAHAGVSVGTASRVLAGSTSTSQSARDRVTAAVAALGYLPDARARSLRRARTDVVGILVSDVRNPFFAELAHAAEQEALRRGSVVMLANADEDPEQERLYLRTFATQRVDGVLMAPQAADRVHLDRLIDSGLPVVFVDRVLPGLDIPTVTSDNAAGVRSAVDHLVARGHRRIGFIGGPTGISTAADRLEAFLEHRAALGLPTDRALLATGDFRQESGEDALERMLASGAEPTALLVADGLMTLGALSALRRRGLPGEIEIVSFDDLAWFEELVPPVSAVVNDAAAMGRLGMAALLDAVDGGAPDSVVVPTRFVDRRAGRTVTTEERTRRCWSRSEQTTRGSR